MDGHASLIFGDTVLSVPLPVNTGTTGELAVSLKHEQLALEILKQLSK